jgi:hypothetical protein
MNDSPIDWTDITQLTHLESRFQARQNIFVITRTPEAEEPSRESLDVAPLPEKKRNGNSLKKICTKILRLYHSKEDLEIFLNEFSVNLNIERRRIYDIVNILEALDIVVKKSKNVYIWKSISLFTTKLRILSAAGSQLADQLKLFQFENRPITSKKKMLTYLALKVLKLFYTTNSVLSFSDIMKICEEHYLKQLSLAFQDGDEFENKNRIRRLYDIINVFKALGLISKVSSKSDKKIYVWQGENGFMAQIAKLCGPSSPLPVSIPKEMPRVHEDLVLGKRLENSAFRLCAPVKGHELLNLRSVLSVPLQHRLNRNFA